MKNLLNLNLLAVLLLSFPAFAVDGMAVIDMRTAVLSTQAAADAFKALKKMQIMHQILKKLSLFKQKDNQLLKNFKKILKPYLKTNSKNAKRYSRQR